MFDALVAEVCICGKRENVSGSVPYTYLIELNGVQGTVPSFVRYEIGEIAKLYVHPYGIWHNLRLVIK